MKRMAAVLAGLSIALAACDGARDIVIVSKALRQQANVNTGVPSEFGASAPPAGNVYWVEGTLRNDGTDAVAKVTVTFKLTDGNVTKVLYAEVANLAPGKSAPFRTNHAASPIALRLAGEGEVQAGR